jgi:tripartite-type tricarboxylate transporter receptor subunit TctC
MRKWLGTCGIVALLGIAGAALSLISSPAVAQPRTIRVLVPFPPGGSADILARLLGDQVGKAQGVTILTENRPGAGATIAYEAAARAAPDGNTVVISANSLVINPILRKVNYDPLTSFEPVCYLLSSPQVVVVNSASPYKTLGDLLAAARAKPGELTFASVGPATTQHIGIELIKHAANVNLTHIPYTGGAPAINALLGGHVTAVFANYSEVVEQVNAGKLRALVVTSKKRIDPLPAVPTMEELGYRDFEVEVWFGLLAPAKTPKNEVAQLADWFTAAMQVPDVKAKLVAIGLYPVGMCGDAYAAHIKKQFEEYARVMRDAGIKGE